MTSIAAVLSPDRADVLATRESLFERLDAMRLRGDEVRDARTIAEPTSVGIAFSGTHWRSSIGVSDGLIVSGDLIIAADARLYYRDDLRRTLAARGMPLGHEVTDVQLLLAAYASFGERCTAHLEGDFAFVIWDGRRGTLFAARDFAGRRTLFHSRHRGALHVASTIGGVLAGTEVSREVSIATVATVAAGLWMQSHETGYLAVHELPAGHTLSAEPGGVPRITRYWEPPDRIVDTRQSLDDASAELQGLLVRAVEERMSPSGPTAISLSGGWDSPAVLGASQVARARYGSRSRTIRPVSISYPLGDPGREDEIIAEILRPWGMSADWIDVESIPLLGDLERAAAAREEPFAHMFEHWNRELSRGARRVGARVILDGSGGDQLFQVSPVFLADLVRDGSLFEARRQWKALGGSGAREFYRQAVRPMLPTVLTRGIARLRGTVAPVHYLERQAPAWFRSQKLDELGVMDRERRERPALPRSSMVLAETHAFLLFPYFTRIMRLLSNFAAEEGVELRSPLLDERVVRFAVSRPWHERVHLTETKRVLRGAMRGVLPDGVLAPRPHRTGVTTGYFLRHFRASAVPYFRAMTDDSRLASIGLIDPARLRRAWEHFMEHDDDELAGRLYFTLQAEHWLRARMG